MLSVKINSPTKIIWEGKVKSISSKNSQGAFDILSQHANFISALVDQEIVLDTGKEKLKYHFDNSLIYAHNNFVSIYTL